MPPMPMGVIPPRGGPIVQNQPMGLPRGVGGVGPMNGPVSAGGPVGGIPMRTPPVSVGGVPPVTPRAMKKGGHVMKKAMGGSVKAIGHGKASKGKRACKVS